MENKMEGIIAIALAVFVLLTAAVDVLAAWAFSVAALLSFGIYRFYHAPVKPPATLVEWYLSDRAKKKEKIMVFLKKHGSITNNNVEKLAGVSDATATRYLEELEEAGLIRQEGKIGRSVSYRAN